MELHNTPQHKSFLWHLDFEPRDNDDFTAQLRLQERWLRTHAKLLTEAVEHSFLL